LAGCSPDLPPVLSDDFEGPALATFWLPGSYGSGRYAPGAVTISSERAYSGTSSAEITVRDGDIDQDGGDGAHTERAELDSGAHALYGEDAWCRFAFLLPSGFPIVDNRLVIAQWKQKGVASPLVAQRFRAGRHYASIWSSGAEAIKHELPPLEVERWHEMVYHIKFSDESTGLVDIWMDGVLVMSWRGQTASPDARNAFYHKIGLYRDHWADPMTIFFDDYVLSATAIQIDVLPSHGDTSTATPVEVPAAHLR
jgi:hypothetical protein